MADARDYFQREDRIRSAALSMGATFLLVTLNRFLGRNASAWPSHSRLAQAMNTTTRSVIRYQKELEDIGVLEVVTGKGCKTSNEYRIHFDRLPVNGDRLSLLEHDGIVTNCQSNSDKLSVGIVTNCHTEQLNRTTQEQHTENRRVSGKPSEEKVSKSDQQLLRFVEAWNQWHREGLVRSQVLHFETRGNGLRKAWTKGWTDPEQRERLTDLESLRTAIAEGREFLKGASWFDAAALVGGKNGNRRWYAQQLLLGVYRDRGAQTPASNPAVSDEEWQKAWSVVRTINVTTPYMDDLRAKLGDRQAEALRKIGVQRIQDASDFQRDRMAEQFRKEITCR